MFRHRGFAGKDLAGCVTAPLISQGFAGFEASDPKKFLGGGASASVQMVCNDYVTVAPRGSEALRAVC